MSQAGGCEKNVKIAIGYRILEGFIIVGAALFATWGFTDLSPQTKLDGIEMEFLTSTAHYAALHLHQHGTIPRWQPLLGTGRPLVESPFGFALNPFSAGASYWLGDGVRGIKVSVIGYAVLAAGGGWFLGWALRMRALGRVTLALLVVGKGNMTALLGIGHYQLAVAQAYMGWVFGAAWLLLTVSGSRQARWSIVLLAVSTTLMFTAGNVWHLLPTLIGLGVLTAAVGVWDGVINWRGLRRIAVAGALTVGLSAVLLVPLWGNRDYIAGQELTRNGDQYANAITLLRQYVVAEPLVETLDHLVPDEQQTRYNYSVPWWFALALMTPIAIRPRQAQAHRIWWVAAILLVVFTMWGIGGLQPFRWAYNTLPGLGRWRFVGRAFGSASLWLAVIVALRTDGIGVWLADQARWGRAAWIAFGGLAISAGLWVIGYNWRETVDLVPVDNRSGACLAWMIINRPTAAPGVHQGGYQQVSVFLDAGVRQTPIEAAYRPLPVAPPTIYDHDLLTDVLPRFAMPIREMDQPFLEENGYTPIEESPPVRLLDTGNRWACLWEKADAPPYAFSARAETLQLAGERRTLTAAAVDPVAVVARGSDYVTVVAHGYGGASAYVTVRETAYPGWQVMLDGQRAELASVGGQIGVQLPLSTDTHVITFVYRPPLLMWGAAITVMTAAGCALYLLGVARVWQRRPSG